MGSDCIIPDHCLSFYFVLGHVTLGSNKVINVVFRSRAIEPAHEIMVLIT